MSPKAKGKRCAQKRKLRVVHRHLFQDVERNENAAGTRTTKNEEHRQTRRRRNTKEDQQHRSSTRQNLKQGAQALREAKS